MIQFNAELWNIHQPFVLQVLYEKKRIPARKVEKMVNVVNYVSTLIKQMVVELCHEISNLCRDKKK